MKKHHLIILIKCVGLTAVGFIMVNLLHAIIDIIQVDVTSIESITINKGAVFIDDSSSGLRLGEASGNQGLWVMFVFLVIINLNKRTSLYPTKSD